jgi:hypothetical protein
VRPDTKKTCILTTIKNPTMSGRCASLYFVGSAPIHTDNGQKEAEVWLIVMEKISTV